MLRGKRRCRAGHCTKKASAMRRRYKSLPDSDNDATRAMLSTYTTRVRRKSLRAGGTGSRVR